MDTSSLDPTKHSFFNENITESEKKELLALQSTNRKCLKCTQFDTNTQIVAYVAHLAKVYSLLLEDDLEVTKIKGISKKDVSLSFISYWRFHIGEKFDLLYSQTKIRPHNFQMFHEKFVKVGSSKLDRKRIWFHPQVSLSTGHYMRPYYEVATAVINSLLDAICPETV